MTIHQQQAQVLNEVLPVQPRLYRVEGQDALRLELHAGDKVCITSADFQQGCELIFMDAQGGVTESPLLDYPLSEAVNTGAQLAQQSESALRLSELLQVWNINEQALQQAHCCSADSLPTFEVSESLTMVVLCCGKDMQVVEQTPVTALQVAHFTTLDADLPPPLATPRSEFRIPRGSATSYEVKAGEWIQIIDVEGKQCSDFIAFDAAALEQGHEVALDAVATRTLNGLTLPQPGLHSKLVDTRQQTMLEVVQDTVGRHDSFLFACNRKFYEDSGYFGHLNCTDNFNRCLSNYGIAARDGWPAINFFFNTSAGDCGTIAFEEPWSRAGDYVLLQANRDLICVSSACPDDIDPANGWNPTDIHVRIYPASCEFPRSVGYRITPEEQPRMTKPTGFHGRTSALTKQFTEYRGYWVASEYQNYGARAEYLACRERVAMIDLTPLRKFEVVGPDAEILLQYALTRNVSRMSIGEVVYSAVCHSTGGMIDDGTLFRLGQHAFRWICGDSYCGIWLRQLAAEKGLQVQVRESTDQIHNVAVQGPQSRNLLQQIIWNAESCTPVAELGWFRFMTGRIGGPDGMPVMVSRTGYTGELGFEVWCHPDQGEQLWDTIWQAGEPYGIAPLGFDALDTLRIEAGLIFAEHEFCAETNPFEAGIGFTVPLKTKTDDFVGRDAIAAQNPLSRKKLVGLMIDSQETVSHGDSVFNGRFPVGVVTSATYSPSLKSQIALCRVEPQFAEPGTVLEVGQLDGQRKRIPVRTTTLPFYDPERTRVRS
jgi:aminomethyltransferase